VSPVCSVASVVGALSTTATASLNQTLVAVLASS